MHHHTHPSGFSARRTLPLLTRRHALAGMGAALTLAGFRSARAAQSFPQRLVIVNIKGGLDGLSAVIPYTERQLSILRAPLVPPPIGHAGGMFQLDTRFALHPALPNLHALYQAGEMLAVHAVGNIATTRSHFTDQAALQTGAPIAANLSTGWMNRLLGQLTNYAGRVEAGVVLSAAMPTIGQGPQAIAAWASSPFADAPSSLAALVETLGLTDPLIGGPIKSGFFDKSVFRDWLKGRTTVTQSPLQASLQQAGIFISSPGGPAVVLVETPSVDTHVDQVALLGPELADLDAAIALLADAAGNTWANTVVMTVTEFGRAAAVNGCAGTDHGTGFAMFLAGGAVRGGQVIAPNWPGLTNLWQNRDLAWSTDVRSVITGVLQDHLKLTPPQLATVFPNNTARPMGGLVNG